MTTGSLNLESGFGSVETEITTELISKAMPLSLYALKCKIAQVNTMTLCQEASMAKHLRACSHGEGAPANRATRLEGLTHSPPLHATHLSGTVSRLRGLPLEPPLSTTNKMADQRNFIFILFQLPALARACSLPETRLLH